MKMTRERYLRGMKCEKILWLDDNKPEEAIADLPSAGHIAACGRISEQAKSYFGKYREVPYFPSEAARLAATQKLIAEAMAEVAAAKALIKDIAEENARAAAEEANVINIANAVFSYNDCLANIDILRVRPNGIEIAQVKIRLADTAPKQRVELPDENMADLNYQRYVLAKCGYKVIRAYTIMPVRDGSLALLPYYNYIGRGSSIIQSPDIDDSDLVVLDTDSDIIGLAKTAESVDEPRRYKDITENCFERDCPYWHYCMRNLPTPNIFDLRWVRSKELFCRNGLFTCADVINKINAIGDNPQDGLEKELFRLLGNNDSRDIYLRWQIEAGYSGQPLIDVEWIRSFVQYASFPLGYLDIGYSERILPCAIVPPNQQMPIQYSLHIEKTGGGLEHYEFLGDTDRPSPEQLAAQLVKDIPTNTRIIVYDAELQKAMLQHLADKCPAYAKQQIAISNSIIGLMPLFKDFHYYVREMHGSYALKDVAAALLPSRAEIDFAALAEIHSNDEAAEAFAYLVGKPPAVIAATRKNLLRYRRCKTLAMARIMEVLRKI